MTNSIFNSVCTKYIHLNSFTIRYDWVWIFCIVLIRYLWYFNLKFKINSCSTSIVFFSATGNRQGHKRSQDQTGHQCRLPNHTATPQFQIHRHLSGRPREADRQQLLHLRRRTRDFDIRAGWQWTEANQVPRILVIHGQVRIQWVFHGQFLCRHWDDSEPVWQL